MDQTITLTGSYPCQIYENLSITNSNFVRVSVRHSHFYCALLGNVYASYETRLHTKFTPFLITRNQYFPVYYGMDNHDLECGPKKS